MGMETWGNGSLENGNTEENMGMEEWGKNVWKRGQMGYEKLGRLETWKVGNMWTVEWKHGGTGMDLPLVLTGSLILGEWVFLTVSEVCEW